MHSSLDKVRQAADASFEEHTTGVRGRAVDDGGSGSGKGDPLVFYTVHVDKARSGAIEPGKDITVAWLDKTEDLTHPSKDGGHYVFLTDFVTTKDAPGAADFGDVYVPHGSDQGVVDIEGNEATFHGNAIKKLTDDQTPRVAALTTADVLGLFTK